MTRSKFKRGIFPLLSSPQISPFMHSTTPSRSDTKRLCRWQYYTMKKKVSRQDEGSNSTFQRFPANTRIRIQLFKSFPPSRGFEFNFSKVSRQAEDSNPTFQKFPAKPRIRIQLFKSFPPSRGFEFNFSKVSRQDEVSNSTKVSRQDERHQQCPMPCFHGFSIIREPMHHAEEA
jgi:hypothetical protein